MELRRPHLTSGYARLIAVLSMIVMAASSGVLLGAGGPASAASSARPTVSYRVTASDSVAVSGRTATARPRVRFERRAGSAWLVVKRIRAHAHRYATTLSVEPGTSQTFRVTTNHRSRTFAVAMPARTAPSAKKPPTLYDECGARPRKADGSAWSCTFHDDFDGTTLDRSKWVPQTVFMTGDKDAGYACYLDDPDNISVGGGTLSLTVRKEATPVACGSPTSSVTSQYSAGSISTYHLFSQQYGRFEARIRNTASEVAGLHEAFWLWPDDRVPSDKSWPDAGEIDISETYSVYNKLSVPFLHYSQDANGPQPGVNTAWDCTAYRNTWNTYVLEWTPSTLTITVNGRTCLVNTSGDPAFQKPYIVSFTQALGQAANKMTASTPIPATMQVDYLRVWK